MQATTRITDSNRKEEGTVPKPAGGDRYLLRPEGQSPPLKVLHQLDKDPTGGRWMQERDKFPSGPRPSPLINWLAAGTAGLRDRAVNVADMERDMVKPWPPCAEKFGQCAARAQGLKQLQQRVSGSQECDPYTVLRQLVSLGDSDAEGRSVERCRLLDAAHRDSDVVNSHPHPLVQTGQDLLGRGIGVQFSGVHPVRQLFEPTAARGHLQEFVARSRFDDA